MSARRKFLYFVGAGAVALGGGLAWRAAGQGAFRRRSDDAYKPWSDWASAPGSDELALVNAAILAASPHNTQPWLFRVGDGSIDLFADSARHLGAFDPYRREMLLGLGCALENLVVGATTLGFATQVQVLPAPAEPTRIAHVELSRGQVQLSPLAQAIPLRHTNRGPYQVTRTLEAQAMTAFLSLADAGGARLVLFEADSPKGKLFADGTILATERIVSDREMYADSERWFRHDWSDIRRRRDGISVLHAGLSPLMTEIAMLAPRISPEDSGAAWLRMIRDTQLPTAPAYGVILVRDLYDPRQAIEAGRLWQRAHLEGTRRGLAMQPINQLMECVDRDRQLGRASQFAEVMAGLGEPGWAPTFGFRVGYARSAASPSARRAVQDCLLVGESQRPRA